MKHIEELVFLFFFILAGIHFELNVLISSFALVMLYVILWCTGKYLGAYGGVKLAGGDKNTQRLLGLGIPEAAKSETDDLG